MTRVPITEPVLRWALERSGGLEVVQRKLPKLSEWLAGRSQPTLRQLEALAKMSSTPFGYLLLPTPPVAKMPIPMFRTRSDALPELPSPDLLETVQTMERRQAWVRDHLIEQGIEPLGFVRSARIGDDPQIIARQMRGTLGIDDQWAARQSNWSSALRELQRRMDASGFLVAVNSVVGNNTHRKLNVREFRGFVMVDEYAPLVFVNGADGKAAQMFTLAHELAHVWFGSSAAFDLRELQPADDETEQVCNKVAAEFLVPADELRHFWSSVRRDSERYQKVARRFKVSEIVVARRALDLQLLTKREFVDFFNAYLEQERRNEGKSQGKGDFYATQNLRVGRRFAEAVIFAAKEGRLLYSEAFKLTGLYGKSFDHYADLLNLQGSK